MESPVGGVASVASEVAGPGQDGLPPLVPPGASVATETPCPDCKGKGMITERAHSATGIMHSEFLCPTCSGVDL